MHCGADPSFAIGGELASTGTNAHDGVDELFVAEADESDGAFLVYTPFGAIVTNVESDHLDNYGTDEAYHEAFETFLGRIANFVVLCTDDPGAAELLAPARGLGLKAISVGEREGAKYPICITVCEVSLLAGECHQPRGRKGGHGK